jgi:hypothetical protein
MRIRILLAVSVLLLALPLLAGSTNLFKPYEEARKAMVAASLPDVQKAAATIVTVAVAEKQQAVAKRARALVKARDLDEAKTAFAALSNEMIKVRAKASGDRPIVVYCPMEEKSWLQPKGTVDNPYVDAGMRTCGEVKAQ